MQSAYWLVNVRLDSSYSYEDGEIAGTETELCHLLIQGGKITEVRPIGPVVEDGLPQKDGRGLLLLPSFHEEHVHIDKTFYHGKWRAPKPFTSVFGRMKEEQQLLIEQKPFVRERAEKLLELFQKNGTTHVRTHCNIDPVQGLHNLEATKAAFETFSGKLSHRIVAFPQHGLLHSNAVGLMKDAMRSGADLVGGLDPATVDRDAEKSLHTTFEIATQFNADIDIHLHEPGHQGVFTLKRIAAFTEQAGWQGRVTVSHFYGLAALPEREAAGIAEMLHGLGISIATSVPIDMPCIPIPLLHNKGVRVMFGIDSIVDHWSPFGSGDMLEKAKTFAERFSWATERQLDEALGFITGGKTTLDDQGNRVWPRVGDEANMVLVEASCSAEAVARISPRRAVFFLGRQVAGDI